MKIHRVRVAGLTCAVLAMIMLSMLMVEYEFPVFKYSERISAELVENETAIIGQKVSQFLWNYRVMDLIAQAFVLFAAAACCMALLRIEEREK